MGKFSEHIVLPMATRGELNSRDLEDDDVLTLQR